MAGSKLSGATHPFVSYFKSFCFKVIFRETLKAMRSFAKLGREGSFSRCPPHQAWEGRE